MRKAKGHSKKGQALFEFIVFVPFMFLTYTVSLNLFSAINGSINQQKVTRGYFYARLKHNSMAPNFGELRTMQVSGATYAGMLALGWRVNPFTEGESDGNAVPKANCYKVATMFSQTQLDECEDKLDENGPTSFIRVKTVYGVCGSSYLVDQNGFFSPSHLAAVDGSCTIQ
jgi:hypothetical protein